MEWLKGQSDPKALEDQLRNSVNMRLVRRLKEILADKVLQYTDPNSDFDSPNWDKKEAFRQGKLKATLEIIDLLSFNEEKK